MRDPYFYDDCDVLQNKLGIKNEKLLEEAEVDISCNAIYEITTLSLRGNYDFDHLCKFHAYIFKDIYEWAGQWRTVLIEKAEAILGYMSIEYAKPDLIEKEATIVLDRMNSIKWQELSLDGQAMELSACMADLWKVHPFREGNTRAVITFICQYADEKGMQMDRQLFEKNAAYMRNALVAATAIFEEGDFRKCDYLLDIVKESIKRGSKF